MVYVLAAASLVEISLLFVALCTCFRSQGLTSASSFSYAVVTLLATLSFVAQVHLLMGLGPHFAGWDVIGISWSLYILRRHHATLRNEWQRLSAILVAHPRWAMLVGGFLGYLALQAILLPPFNNDSLAYNLARIFFCIQEGTPYPSAYTSLHQAVFPLGYDIIHYWIIRTHGDLGIGIFGFLCYLGILSGTYSHLASQSSRRVALIGVLMVGTLMEFVLMATSTKNDLPCALLSLVSLIAISQYQSQRKNIHLTVLAETLVFGLSVKTYFVGWISLLAVYGIYLLIRNSMAGKHAPKMAEGNGGHNWCEIGFWPACLLIPIIVFYSVIALTFGHPFGPDYFREGHQNRDGMTGAVANASRYFVQIVQWPRALGGDVFTELHHKLLGEHEKIGVMSGIEVDLAGPPRGILPQEDLSWFGPLAWLLIGPSLCRSLWRSRGFERAASWLVAAFAGLICYSIGWAPWNGRFFLMVFSCSTFWMRTPLEAIVAKPFRRNILVAFCICQGLLSATLNYEKPFIDVYGMAATIQQQFGTKLLERGSVAPTVKVFPPHWVDDVIDRERHYNKMFGNNFVTHVREELMNVDRLSIIAAGSSIYPFLIGLKLPLDTLIAAPASSGSQTNSIDAVLVLGDTLNPQAPDFELVASSDLGDKNCQKGILLKRKMQTNISNH